MPSPRATTSLSSAAAATARPRLHRGRRVCACYTRPRGVPRVAQNPVGQAFHESARLGMLAFPDWSEMAGRQRRFLDRVEAGRLLAEVVTSLVRPPVLVLGVPRGGVVVAAQVAFRLGAPLDVVVPRKVGAPGNPELAVGAVAGGVRAPDGPAIRRLGLNMPAVRAEAARQTAEVARRTAAYRDGLQPLELAGRTAVLVDDGVATGWTCAAAASYTRRAGASRVLVAVPVGP